MNNEANNPIAIIQNMRSQLVAHRKMIEEFTNANLDQYSHNQLLQEAVSQLQNENKGLQDQLAKKDEEIMLLKTHLEPNPCCQPDAAIKLNPQGE